MGFLKKNYSNILFLALVIFLFTPYGLPVRALLIKGVSFVTTRVLNLEVDKNERTIISSYDWNLIDQQGNTINFNQFKDKVIVLNFWATWCPPCIAEMPSFQKLYDKNKNDVVFIFLANDEKDRVEKFMKKKEFTLPIYYQVATAPKELQSNVLPTTFIINKKGEIVVNKTGAVDWNSGKVEDLLLGLLQ